MTAETIAKALGGWRAGVSWMVRCPAHDDRMPSLSIRDANDGKILYFARSPLVERLPTGLVIREARRPSL